jgi:DNA-binding response OmpR family regulator
MKKILIIEDEKMLTDIYEERFKRENFDVYTAVSAEEGLEKTIEVRPDLIILDILLPKGNGTDFLENLQKIDDLKDTKVIAYSNYDDTETREKAIRLGAKDYLIKTNYTPKEILDLIKKHIKE